jgi:hypothetical protein
MKMPSAGIELLHAEGELDIRTDRHEKLTFKKVGFHRGPNLDLKLLGC